MAMQTSTDNPKGEPMMDMNVVPLIDVLLVLLIMFIITIPVQSHAVKLDLPQDQTNLPPPPIDPVKNKVVVTASNQILWNGAPVSPQQLRLSAASRTSPRRRCRKPTFAVMSTRPIAVSAVRCSRCSAPVSPASASFPSRRPAPSRRVSKV